jgi:hypothetical protein
VRRDHEPHAPLEEAPDAERHDLGGLAVVAHHEARELCRLERALFGVAVAEDVGAGRGEAGDRRECCDGDLLSNVIRSATPFAATQARPTG